MGAHSVIYLGMGSASVESRGGADAPQTERPAGSIGDSIRSNDRPTSSTDEPTRSSDEPTLTEGELFDLLSNQRRRHILHALIHDDRTLDIGTLSREIAAWEDDLSIDDVSSSDRKRVYTALQQSHLPKMDKAGVIDFDRDHGTIQPTPALEDVGIYMEIVRGREIPWSDYYLGLTALSGIVLAGAAFSIYPFELLPSSVWSGFVVVAFGISALVHRYYSRTNRLDIDGEPSERLHADSRRERR